MINPTNNGSKQIILACENTNDGSWMKENLSDFAKKNKVEIKKGNLLNGIYIVELKGEKVFKNKMVIIK